MVQGIEFHEEERKNFSASMLNREKSPRGIAGWLIQKNIAKDKSSAGKILLIFSCGMFLLAIVIYFSKGGGKGTPTYYEDIPPEIRDTLPKDILERLPSKYE